MNRTLEVVKCEDGSQTLFIPEMNETYHSTHGAITESQYVFIKMGLDFVNKDRVSILEIGLGTGLNALITAHNVASKGPDIDFTSLEPYPIEKEILDQLTYDQILDDESCTLKDIHAAPWETFESIHSNFRLQKKQTQVMEYQGSGHDLIYFDAFAPSKQPEMWTVEVMQKMAQVLNPGGVLVTYCAQGQMKRNLKEAGFEIERLPGPPGKNEMTRATLVK